MTHNGHDNSNHAVVCCPLMVALRTLREYYLMTENQNLAWHERGQPRENVLTCVPVLLSCQGSCCSLSLGINCWDWRLWNWGLLGGGVKRGH